MPTRFLATATAWLVTTACTPGARTRPESNAPGPAASPVAAGPAAASKPSTPAVAAQSSTVAPEPPKLAFVEDDYEKARADALKKGAPLFVDVWASWCHSCMSMKEVVFPDPAMVRLGDAFVWLSIDSENEK